MIVVSVMFLERRYGARSISSLLQFAAVVVECAEPAVIRISEGLVVSRRRHPEVIIAANKEAARESLRILLGESWSFSSRAERHLLPHVGMFVTLKRMSAILAAAIDEGRSKALRNSALSSTTRTV